MMDNRQNVLTDIKNGLMLNMESNSNNEKELTKLIYFANYHNRKVSEDGSNFPYLAIDIPEVEEKNNER